MRTLSDFKDLEQMKIMRFCTNKFDDYATFHKQAILLDDADFYVVLLNKNGEQIKLDKMIDVPVTICGEHYIFTNFVSSLNERESEERVLQGVYGATYGWCFIKEKQGGRATPQTEIMNPEKKKAIIKSKSSAGLLREKKVGDVASNIEVVEAEMRNRLLSEPQDSNSKIFFRNSV